MKEYALRYDPIWKKRTCEIVINAYGSPVCACCHERKELDFLQIDHKDGNGNQHRKTIKRNGTAFYTWLRANGFPPGYQVLCADCNLAKRNKRECPHVLLRTNMLERLAKIPLEY